MSVPKAKALLTVCAPLLCRHYLAWRSDADFSKPKKGDKP